MIQDHFITLVIYSVLVALFFATMTQKDRAGYLKCIGKILGWMVLGSLGLAYLMMWTGR